MVNLPKCGLVILNYRDAKRSLDLAQISITYANICHVVIVDNFSDDDSFDFLSKNNSNENITIIQSGKNGGFSFGNNVGINFLIKNYVVDFIICANPDTLWKEENVDKCLNKLMEDQSLGLVSTRIIGPNGNEQNSSWPFSTVWDSCLSNFWLYNRLKYKRNKNIIYENAFQYVDIVRGSFMFFRTTALIECDFFDENIFLYGEEAIIAKKLQMKGYKVGLLTDCYYVHNHIESKQGNYLKTRKLMRKSKMYFLKNYCNISLIQEIILRVFNFFGIIENSIINLIKYLKRRKYEK